MIEPETAVILSQTSASPAKGGLVNLNPEELEEPPSNEGPFFEVVDLSSASTASTIDFSTPITPERDAAKKNQIDENGNVIGSTTSKG